LRSAIVPKKPAMVTPGRTPAERHTAMTWAQRLARAFKIDVARCERCGGPVRSLASLTDPAVLDRIVVARGGAELHGPARGRYRKITVRIRAWGQECPHCLTPALVGDAVGDATVSAAVP
jgi:hypothetical protein